MPPRKPRKPVKRNLVDYKSDGSDIDYDDPIECQICWHLIRKKIHQGFSAGCITAHVYHVRCLIKWLRACNEDNRSCPCCRNENYVLERVHTGAFVPLNTRIPRRSPIPRGQALQSGEDALEEIEESEESESEVDLEDRDHYEEGRQPGSSHRPVTRLRAQEYGGIAHFQTAEECEADERREQTVRRTLSEVTAGISGRGRGGRRGRGGGRNFQASAGRPTGSRARQTERTQSQPGSSRRQGASLPTDHAQSSQSSRARARSRRARQSSVVLGDFDEDEMALAQALSRQEHAQELARRNGAADDDQPGPSSRTRGAPARHQGLIDYSNGPSTSRQSTRAEQSAAQRRSNQARSSLAASRHAQLDQRGLEEEEEEEEDDPETQRVIAESLQTAQMEEVRAHMEPFSFFNEGEQPVATEPPQERRPVTGRSMFGPSPRPVLPPAPALPPVIVPSAVNDLEERFERANLQLSAIERRFGPSIPAPASEAPEARGPRAEKGDEEMPDEVDEAAEGPGEEEGAEGEEEDGDQMEFAEEEEEEQTQPTRKGRARRAYIEDEDEEEEMDEDDSSKRQTETETTRRLKKHPIEDEDEEEDEEEGNDSSKTKAEESESKREEGEEDDDESSEESGEDEEDEVEAEEEEGDGLDEDNVLYADQPSTSAEMVPVVRKRRGAKKEGKKKKTKKRKTKAKDDGETEGTKKRKSKRRKKATEKESKRSRRPKAEERAEQEHRLKSIMPTLSRNGDGIEPVIDEEEPVMKRPRVDSARRQRPPPTAAAPSPVTDLLGPISMGMTLTRTPGRHQVQKDGKFVNLPSGEKHAKKVDSRSILGNAYRSDILPGSTTTASSSHNSLPQRVATTTVAPLRVPSPQRPRPSGAPTRPLEETRDPRRDLPNSGPRLPPVLPPMESIARRSNPTPGRNSTARNEARWEPSSLSAHRMSAQRPSNSSSLRMDQTSADRWRAESSTANSNRGPPYSRPYASSSQLPNASNAARDNRPLPSSSRPHASSSHHASNAARDYQMESSAQNRLPSSTLSTASSSRQLEPSNGSSGSAPRNTTMRDLLSTIRIPKKDRGNNARDVSSREHAVHPPSHHGTANNPRNEPPPLPPRHRSPSSSIRDYYDTGVGNEPGAGTSAVSGPNSSLQRERNFHAALSRPVPSAPSGSRTLHLNLSSGRARDEQRGPNSTHRAAPSRTDPARASSSQQNLQRNSSSSTSPPGRPGSQGSQDGPSTSQNRPSTSSSPNDDDDEIEVVAVVNSYTKEETKVGKHEQHKVQHITMENTLLSHATVLRNTLEAAKKGLTDEEYEELRQTYCDKYEKRRLFNEDFLRKEIEKAIKELKEKREKGEEEDKQKNKRKK